ncbi:MAG: methyltransferase, TIGR04325 family [Deltaproteobacteria bacterium]|uniref:methyltransferase, TIGR04325 family n=1 Tax=Desulfobacula sp. TaxID=2593537 RepID=UPI0019CBEDBA|nr:methyltransferase, TIGR04325 family [Candidatus Desulfobacula maris]MBL6992779.1 methyltransferase, TIGR04325 family [Desulfobacula sp.]
MKLQKLKWLFKTRVPINGFWGVFDSFEEASHAGPQRKNLGYDAARTGGWYREWLDSVQNDDYAMLFWFEKALLAIKTPIHVVEIGGHVGIAYYSFEKVISYPPELKWIIVDVPSVTKAGRKLALERNKTNIAFINSFAEVDEPVDILLASGSLQYVPGEILPDQIRKMARKPNHIIINKTPVTNSTGYITLQNLGAYCCYRIHSYKELVEPFLLMGYELVNSWKIERQVIIPGHPERKVDGYWGYYLRKKGENI